MKVHRLQCSSIGVLAVLLMACGGPGAAPLPAPASTSAVSSAAANLKPDVTELKATSPSISAHQLAMYVAADAGLWKREGLNVELISTKSLAVALPAMTSGEMQFGLLNGPETTSAQVKGAPLVFVAGAMPKYDFGVYAKGTASKLQDLAGKTVAVTKPGSSTEFALRAAMTYYKMESNSIKVLYAGGVPEALAAVIGGGVADAAVLSPPTNVAAEKAGLKQVVYVGDLPIRFLDNGLVASSSFARQHPSSTMAFISGYVAAIALLKHDKKQSEAALAHYADTTDPEALDAGYEAAARLYEQVPLVTEADVRGALAEGGEQAAANGDVSSFYDNSFIEKLESDGFIAGLYK